MSYAQPKIFSISPMASFVETLAKSIVEGRLIKGWPNQTSAYSLSAATIYMPTKRSAEKLAVALKAQTNYKSLLLPKIITIGEITDNENIFDVECSVEKLNARKGDLAEISPLKRRLILTKLIISWSQKIQDSLDSNIIDVETPLFLHSSTFNETSAFSVARTISDGLALADSLGHLIDTLAIYKKTWQDVHSLLPQDLSDDYWSLSKDFLQIAAEAWPAYCHQEGVMDAVEHRDSIILEEAERLLKEMPQRPIIIAGSTGSMPSTAKLISAISKLPNGAVVLPGIDQYLDNESCLALDNAKSQNANASHPQSVLSKLIRQIGVDRQTIVELADLSKSLKFREIFLSECMRPYETAHLWSGIDERIKKFEISEGIQGVSLIESENEHEESIAISLMLRMSLETPGKTAALITPDRSIAKRVNLELLRWGILTDDSAGTPLHRSPLGTLVGLLLNAICGRFSPVTLLSLLKHDEVHLGLTKDELQKGISAIDLGLSRILLKSNDIDGIYEAFERLSKIENGNLGPNPIRRLTKDDWNCADIILKKIISIYKPFQDMKNSEVVDFFNKIDPTLKRILSSPDDPGGIRNISGSLEISELFTSIQSSTELELDAPIESYVTFFDQLMAGYTVPSHSASHPRIKILGLLEARLLRFDLVILGGLDEGIWPPETRSDPFLNRPWREELGLPTPERRIGQTAHDLISALGAETVIITRSLKRAGSPMIASRFIQRMIAVAGKEAFNDIVKRGEIILGLARKIDEAPIAKSELRPKPIPPPHLLPRKLSVTEIELLRRDPYSIYAKHVLKLDHLEKIGYQFGSSERGNIYHLILARFAERWPLKLPDDALNKFLSLSEEILSSYHIKLNLEPFWSARLQETGKWYLHWEELRRGILTEPLALERRGALTITLPRGGEFTISGQVDRIEFLENGEFNIVDYKTGRIPSQLQVKVGFSPQLTLEAAMLKRNAFAGLFGVKARNLIYVKIGSKGGGDEKPIRDINVPVDCDELVERHFSEFIKLADDHWNGSRPFYSRPHPQFTTDFGKYDHLARFREWSLIGENSDIGDDE